jgi:hypothetical protein
MKMCKPLLEACDAHRSLSTRLITKVGGPEVSRFNFPYWRHLALALFSAISVACFTAIAFDRRGADIPDTAILQNAYDREADSGSAAHDANLRVVDALCNRRQQLPGMFLCVVAFTDRRDPKKELYYDIAEVAAVGSKWRLESGLCKR